MLSWLKQKPRLTPRAQYPPEIVQAIHTMADDMSGKSKTDEGQVQEPLASFQPGQGAGTPFYAAPEIQAAAIADMPSAPSPFLDGAGSAEEPKEMANASEASVTPVINENSGQTEVVSEDVAEAMIPTRLNNEEYIVPDKEMDGAKGMHWWQASKKLIIFGSGVVILLLGGAFAWWYSQKKPVTDNPPVIATGDVPGEMPQISIESDPAQTVASGEHYSTTQPNLLSFDTESVTAESMTTELLKIARSIEQNNLKEPVEFLIRDQNYNPLAFARFAYLLKLDLPADLLSTLDESFSLYFYLDQDRPRLGLKVQIKNKEAFLAASKAGESVLPRALTPLFLDTTTAPRTGLVFRSSLYQEQPVRYANIDQEMNLSVDYAVREQSWLIGTSQSTLRAMLDRLTPAP